MGKMPMLRFVGVRKSGTPSRYTVAPATSMRNVAPPENGITIRAAKGEKAIVSGADLIVGWKRDGEKWTAPLQTEPRKLLRDGNPWSFSYDAAAKTISLHGFDPRLHVMETVVREAGIDQTGRKDVKVEGVEVVNALGEAPTGAAK